MEEENTKLTEINMKASIMYMDTCSSLIKHFEIEELSGASGGFL